MVALKNKKIFFLLSGCFIIAQILLLHYNESIYLAGGLIPVVLLIILLLSFSDIRPFYIFLILCIPFSIKTNLLETDIQMLFPGEFVEGIFFIVYVLRYFTGKQKFDPAFFFHPVTLCILFFFGFSLVTLLFSTMMTVSIKTMLVKMVYAGVFYFFLHEIIKTAPEKSLSMFIYYGFAITSVVLYSLYNHAGYQFSKDTSGIVSLPFYADHTIYSCCLAFILPVFLMHTIKNKTPDFMPKYRSVYFVISVILLFGIFFSLCRATWISLVAGLGMLFLIRLKVKPVTVFSAFLLVATLIYLNQEPIIGIFKQNRYDSNARGAGLEEQTKSITNISNDQSNGERINRWKCAIRMFEEKPWVGFGPGTYQFQYIPFQRQKDMTRISVSDPFHIRSGHGGTAHSEYLLVLSESGILTFVSFISLIMITVAKAMRNSVQMADKRFRYITIAILIGLITYLTHGLFNNFLDTDKAAFLFWGALSILTTIDIQMKKRLIT